MPQKNFLFKKMEAGQRKENGYTHFYKAVNRLERELVVFFYRIGS